MVSVLDVLAENNFGDTRSGGLAGPLGLLIVVLLGIATVLLIRNMNARLRRLPDSFPEAIPGAAGIERVARDGHRDPRRSSRNDQVDGVNRKGAPPERSA